MRCCFRPKERPRAQRPTAGACVPPTTGLFNRRLYKQLVGDAVEASLLPLLLLLEAALTDAVVLTRLHISSWTPTLSEENRRLQLEQAIRPSLDVSTTVLTPSLSPSPPMVAKLVSLLLRSSPDWFNRDSSSHAFSSSGNVLCFLMAAEPTGE